MKRKKIIAALLFFCPIVSTYAQSSYREDFLNPKEENRTLIIWQWMDGLVNKEAITKDLEAFKAAGLAGVQNFQIGGNLQGLIGDPTCAIGSEKWKEMMRWAMEECDRLGLSFGTHNCPGWSSSAYSNVTPEYSMQKLVYSEIKLTAEDVRKLNNKKSNGILLPRPEIDPKYNYYEDIAILAFPNDSIVKKTDIIDLTDMMMADSVSLSRLPLIKMMSPKEWVILRFGHTTNGKSNSSQSPESGQGLECDKMRREAVKIFWNGYPKMLLEIAGDLAGKTFTRIEIDSYEAGGQNWSVVLPQEFQIRKGYDIIPYLPYIAGRTVIGSKEECIRFKKDLVDVATSLFAENYYGYMSELTSQIPGMQLVIEPYGTSGQKPFQVLDIYKILKCAPDALVATEFWVKPNWGWKDMGNHEKVIRNTQRPILYAEGFTSWPLHAWKDDPQSLKPICDRAYCTGVNRMMLHAGAVDPWTNVEPGMSFGKWGTQFVPNQTWWKAGGAKALFDYMARCQSLLQRGKPAKEQWNMTPNFKSYKRIDGDNEIIFVCNPTDKAMTDTLDLDSVTNRKFVELWDPYTLAMATITEKKIPLTIEPCGSRFIVITTTPIPSHSSEKMKGNNLLTLSDSESISSIHMGKGWKLTFPSPENESHANTIDTLFDWSTSSVAEFKYFSGTATYSNSITLKKKQLKGKQVVLDLGEVKNIATVRINGQTFPVMWKAPFLLDITSALKSGKNMIEIDVTNLWPNRMIGDEQEPDDIEWSEPFKYEYAPGSPVAGYFMKTIPDWLRNGTPRPSQGRKTVGGFKFFTADSPLLPSGLLGPVIIQFQ